MADRLFPPNARESFNSDGWLRDVSKRDGGSPTRDGGSPTSRLDALLSNTSAWRNKDSNAASPGAARVSQGQLSSVMRQLSNTVRVESPDPMMKESRLSINSLLPDDRSAAPGSPQKDHVLLRCRETIDKLQTEVEEERRRRKDMQKKASMLDTSFSQALQDLDGEKQKLRDQEALARRTRMDLKHSEQRMQRLETVKDENLKQLNLLKQDHLSRERDREMRIRELEQSLTAAEMQSGTLSKQSSTLESQVQHLSDEKENLRLEMHRQRSHAEDAERAHEDHLRQVEDQARVKQEQAQQQVDELKTELRKQQEELRSIEAVTHRYEELQIVAKQREQSIREELVQKGKQLDRVEQQTQRETATLRMQLDELQRDSERHCILKEQHNELLKESRRSQSHLNDEVVEHDAQQRELKRYQVETASMREEIESCRRQADKSAEERRLQQEKWFALSVESTERERKIESLEKNAEDRGEEHERELRRRDGLAMTQNEEMHELQRRMEDTIRNLQLELAEAKSSARLELERRKDLERLLESEQSTHKEARTRLDETMHEMERLRDRTGATETESRQVHMSLQEAQTQAHSKLIEADNSIKELRSSLKIAGDERDKLLKENEAQKQQLEQKIQDLVKEAELRGVEFARKNEAMHHESLAAREAMKTDMSEAVAKLRRKFEGKLQRMNKQLVERESYEQKLKSLLEMEVENVGKLHRELDQSQALRNGEPSRYGTPNERSYAPPTSAYKYKQSMRQQQLTGSRDYTGTRNMDYTGTRNMDYTGSRNMDDHQHRHELPGRMDYTGTRHMDDDDLGLDRFSRTKGRSVERSVERVRPKESPNAYKERWLTAPADSSEESDGEWMNDVVKKVSKRVIRTMTQTK